jgi:hypothetical protein
MSLNKFWEDKKSPSFLFGIDAGTFSFEIRPDRIDPIQP